MNWFWVVTFMDNNDGGGWLWVAVAGGGGFGGC